METVFTLFGTGTIAVFSAVLLAALGVGIALATTIAFLPAVASEGMAQFGRARAITPIADALARRLAPDDVVAHEGPIENGATLLLRVAEPVKIGRARKR